MVAEVRRSLCRSVAVVVDCVGVSFSPQQLLRYRFVAIACGIVQRCHAAVVDGFDLGFRIQKLIYDSFVAIGCGTVQSCVTILIFCFEVCLIKDYN